MKRPINSQNIARTARLLILVFVLILLVGIAIISSSHHFMSSMWQNVIDIPQSALDLKERKKRRSSYHNANAISKGAQESPEEEHAQSPLEARYRPIEQRQKRSRDKRRNKNEIEELVEHLPHTSEEFEQYRNLKSEHETLLNRLTTIPIDDDLEFDNLIEIHYKNDPLFLKKLHDRREGCLLLRYLPGCACDVGNVRGGSFCAPKGIARCEQGKCIPLFRTLPRTLVIPYKVSESQLFEKLHRKIAGGSFQSSYTNNFYYIPNFDERLQRTANDLHPQNNKQDYFVHLVHRMCLEQRLAASQSAPEIKMVPQVIEKSSEEKLSSFIYPYRCRAESYPFNTKYWHIANDAKFLKHGRQNSPLIETLWKRQQPIFVRLYCTIESRMGITNVELSIAACLGIATDMMIRDATIVVDVVLPAAIDHRDSAKEFLADVIDIHFLKTFAREHFGIEVMMSAGGDMKPQLYPESETQGQVVRDGCENCIWMQTDPQPCLHCCVTDNRVIAGSSIAINTAASWAERKIYDIDEQLRPDVVGGPKGLMNDNNKNNNSTSRRPPRKVFQSVFRVDEMVEQLLYYAQMQLPAHYIREVFVPKVVQHALDEKSRDKKESTGGLTIALDIDEMKQNLTTFAKDGVRKLEDQRWYSPDKNFLKGFYERQQHRKNSAGNNRNDERKKQESRTIFMNRGSPNLGRPGLGGKRANIVNAEAVPDPTKKIGKKEIEMVEPPTVTVPPPATVTRQRKDIAVISFDEQEKEDQVVDENIQDGHVTKSSKIHRGGDGRYTMLDVQHLLGTSQVREIIVNLEQQTILETGDQDWNWCLNKNLKRLPVVDYKTKNSAYSNQRVIVEDYFENTTTVSKPAFVRSNGKAPPAKVEEKIIVSKTLRRRHVIKENEQYLVSMRVIGVHSTTFLEYRSGSWLPTVDWLQPSDHAKIKAKQAIDRIFRDSLDGKSYLAVHLRYEEDAFGWTVGQGIESSLEALVREFETNKRENSSPSNVLQKRKKKKKFKASDWEERIGLDSNGNNNSTPPLLTKKSDLDLVSNWKAVPRFRRDGLRHKEDPKVIQVYQHMKKLLDKIDQLARDLNVGAVFITNDPPIRDYYDPNDPRKQRPWFSGASFSDKNKGRTRFGSLVDRIIVESATVAVVWDPFTGLSSFSQKIYDHRCRRMGNGLTTFSYSIGAGEERDESLVLEC